MTFDLFMVWSNLCPTCCGNTGRLLHSICRCCIAFTGERIVAHGPLVSSPEHEVLMVSYRGQSMSVVRHASSVVHYALSTIALKAYSSYTPGPIDSILGRKHRGDL